MNNEYTVDYFIRKFEAIPDDLWLSGDLYSEAGGPNGPRCAIGHCSNLSRRDPDTNTKESVALAAILGRSILGVAHINDGREACYQQPTPKQRILAALHDIKRQQEQNNLRQCGVESRHAPGRSKVCGGALILAQGAVSEAEHNKPCKQAGRLETDDHLASGPSYDHPERSHSPSSAGPLPHSPSPMAALAKLMPCHHLYLADCCVYCGTVRQPMEGVAV